MEMQQQDDSSSFLGNETSSSPGYANLSLFSNINNNNNSNGKVMSPLPINSKPNGANKDSLPAKSNLFALMSGSLDTKSPDPVTRNEGGITTSIPLELHSLSSDTNVGDASTSPSLIGVLTPVKRPLNNGFVVKETVLPLPPPPNQSPPPWPPRDGAEEESGGEGNGDDPTPTTSLVLEGGSSFHLDAVVNVMNRVGHAAETEEELAMTV